MCANTFGRRSIETLRLIIIVSLHRVPWTVGLSGGKCEVTGQGFVEEND